jgi:hypothetical protein
VGLVLVLLPTGSKKQDIDTPQISAAEAATAATSTFADLSQFCTRRPEACTVGAQVAAILGQRAQAGAKMVYEFATERREGDTERERVAPARNKAVAEGRGADHADTTGSIKSQSVLPRPRPERSQDTLTASDRQPTWRTPDLRQEAQLRHPG